MAAPSYTYTLTNGTTADASQVMQDFNDILNGVSDGTKDLTFNALTVNAAANLKAGVTLGASSANTLTINAALASTIAINTNNSYAIGSSTKGLSGLFLGNAGAGATCQIVSASHATTRNYTVPDCGAAANFLMSQGAQTCVGATTFSNGVLFGNSASSGTSFTSNSLTDTFYEEATLATTVNNVGAAAVNITFKLVRMGKSVTIHVTSPATGTKNNSSNPAVVDALPAAYRPSATTYLPWLDRNGGTYQMGLMSIDTLGNITMSSLLNTWTASGVCEIQTGAGSYQIA